MNQTYNNPKGIRRAISEVLKVQIEEVELAYTGDGFTILRPEGAKPDPDEVANWEPLVIEPEPVDPLDQFRQLFSSAVSQAQQKIINLKAECCQALIAGGMDRDSAVGAGVQFATHPTIKSAINDYELAGGHPLAAAAFKAAAESVKPPWLSPEILTLWDAL